MDITGGDQDLLAAWLDDFAPTAIEARDRAVRVFFAHVDGRNAAREALPPPFQATAIDVSDEDWARRSQETLQPVTVGRITVLPKPAEQPDSRPHGGILLVIQPSLGFGTGHHATTRLCLDAAQTADLAGKQVLDVGTGSGILAIAAARLGAASAMGLDMDADAIESARENLTLNRDAQGVRFEVGDLATAALPRADAVFANLTGALLERSASTLLGPLRTGGLIIISGLQTHERDQVVRAFAGAETIWERVDDSWVGLAMKKI